MESLVNATLVEEAAIVKWKPGRPPGRRKVAASPKTARSSRAKKRKSGTAPSCRKQLNTEEVRAVKKKALRNAKGGNVKANRLRGKIPFIRSCTPQ